MAAHHALGPGWKMGPMTREDARFIYRRIRGTIADCMELAAELHSPAYRAELLGEYVALRAHWFPRFHS